MFTTVIYAAEEAGKSQNTGLSMIVLLLVYVAIYFLLIHMPRRQKQKKLDKIVEELKVGDKVETDSGIIATVATINDDSLKLKTDKDSYITIKKDRILKKYID